MPQLLGLNLDISSCGGERICYLLLPGPLKESESGWLESMAARSSSYIVVVSGIDWENALTPWEAPGIRSGSRFGSGAENFLNMLAEELMPEVESNLGLKQPKRYIAGVSLSGLFALWASCRCPFFEAVGSVSGSLWYDGFTDWLCAQHPMSDKYYFSLGIKEKDGKNARLASVEQHTLRAISVLEDAGATVFFEYNEGNHFGPLLERMEKAMLYIL